MMLNGNSQKVSPYMFDIKHNTSMLKATDACCHQTDSNDYIADDVKLFEHIELLIEKMIFVLEVINQNDNSVFRHE